MNKTELLALAERVEQADGPNYALEQDIAEAVWRVKWNKARPKDRRVPNYTASIDAAHDFSTDPERRQWHSNMRIVDLNPKGRPQTRKYRPAVPVGARAASLFDHSDGFFVGVDSVKQAFSSMLDDLRLPRDGETGMKLIRRSMATEVRRRIGEEHFVQVERMLGHRKASTSDLYALFEPGMLGRALQATNDIIEEIERLAPGAFYRKNTGLRLIKGGSVA